MRRCVFIVVVATMLGVASPAVADVVLTFDDIAAGTTVGDQYRSRGAVFGPKAPGQGQATAGLPVVTEVGTSLAASGSRIGKVSRTCVSAECVGTTEVWVNFNLGRQSRAAVSVGSFGTASNTITLTAFDINGKAIATDTDTVTGGQPIRRVMNVTGPGIAFLRVRGSTAGPIGIDSLSFEGAVATPSFGVRPSGATSVRLFEGESAQGIDFTIDRTNYTGPVRLTVDPATLPFRVTATTVETTGTTARIVLTALSGAQLTPGKAFLVNATATGLTSRATTATAIVQAHYDARVTGIEVTQGTQVEPALPWSDTATADLKFYTGVRLQGNGTTIVRVYANNRLFHNGTGFVPGVGLRLHGTDAATGAALPGSPVSVSELRSLIGSTQTVPNSTDRLQPAFTVRLPDAWTGTGPGMTGTKQITLRAELVLPPSSVLVQCTALACFTNDSQRLGQVVFKGTCCTKVVLVRMVYRRADDPGGTRFPLPYPDPPADSGSILRMLGPALNISPREFRGHTTYATTYDMGPMLRKEFEMLAKGQLVDSKPGDPGFGVDYDCFTAAPANSDMPMNPRCFGERAGDDMAAYVNRLGLQGDVIVGVWSDRFDVAGVGSTGLVYVGENLNAPMATSHELHHGIGRNHAGRQCAGGMANDSWLPDDQGFIQGIGLDRRSAFPFTLFGPPLNALPQYYDVMSYCVGTGALSWVAPRAWDALISTAPVAGASAATASAASAAGHAHAPVAVAAQAGTPLRLVVRASQTAAGQVTIDAVAPGAGAHRVKPVPTPMHVVVRDAAGAQVGQAQLGAGPTPQSHSGAPAVTPLHAAVAVPLDRAATVEIVRDGAVVASRTRSATAPTGSFLSPRRGQVVGGDRALDIRWRASDADGDRLTTTIEWSARGGAPGTWRAVFAGPNGGRVKLPEEYFAGTARGVLRLRINDGFRETVVLSPRFRTAHRRPTVRIVSPAAGAIVPQGRPLSLTVAAFTERGEPITGRRVTWFDGKRRVGRGDRVTLENPTIGTHRLRVEVRDAGGRRAQARTTVRVTSVAPRFVGLTVPSRLGATARTVRLRLASTVPARLSVSGRGVRRQVVRVGSATRSVVVRIRAGSRPLTLQLALRAGGRTTRVTQIVARG